MKKSLFLIMMLLLILMTVSCSSNSMEELPEGNLLATAESPDGTYRVETYLCTDKAVMHIRCEVVEISTNESRNIYWAKYVDDIDIEWIDNSTVKIEDKTLNVQSDYFDYRNEE